MVSQPGSGRPPEANEAFSQLLGEMTEKEPAKLGYRFSMWTIERLPNHLAKETGIELSERRFRALLKRESLRY